MADINVTEVVQKTIAEHFNRELSELTPEANLSEDLHMDSLDLTDLVMALEEEFNVLLDDDVNEINTVGDVVSFIEAKLAEAE